jgi:hypothetical protein
MRPGPLAAPAEEPGSRGSEDWDVGAVSGHGSPAGTAIAELGVHCQLKLEFAAVAEAGPEPKTAQERTHGRVLSQSSGHDTRHTILSRGVWAASAAPTPMLCTSSATSIAASATPG